jgi:hypothetical protein
VLCVAGDDFGGRSCPPGTEVVSPVPSESGSSVWSGKAIGPLASTSPSTIAPPVSSARCRNRSPAAIRRRA